MYPGKVNSPSTALSAAILAGTTTISVADSTDLPAAPNEMTIGPGEDAETILFHTDASANSFAGVTRAFQGVAKAWPINSPVARRHTAYDYDALRQNLQDMTLLSGTAGENLTQYQVCYLDPAAGTWKVANTSYYAQGMTGQMLAMALETKSTGQTVTLALRGIIEAGSSLWSSYVNKMVYLTYAGAFSNVATTGRRVPIGVVLSATQILFDPTLTIVEPCHPFDTDVLGNHTIVASATQDSITEFYVKSLPMGTFNLLTKLKVCGHFTSHTGAIWTAAVNSGTGISPTATSIPYDGSAGTIATNDYIKIDNEIMKVTDANGGSSPLTVTRAVKGTRATYHDDNASIEKTHGIRIEVYKSGTAYGSNLVYSKSNIHALSTTLRASITNGDYLAKLNADPSGFTNMDEAIIDGNIYSVNKLVGNVADDTYDNSIFTSDPINAADSSDPVYGVDVTDISAIGSGVWETDQYGYLIRVSIDEHISSNVDVFIGLAGTRLTI